MKIAELLEQKLKLWLLYKGVSAAHASISEGISNDYGDYSHETYIFYTCPDGTQGSRTFDGSLESFIDELDAVEEYR